MEKLKKIEQEKLDKIKHEKNMIERERRGLKALQKRREMEEERTKVKKEREKRKQEVMELETRISWRRRRRPSCQIQHDWLPGQGYSEFHGWSDSRVFQPRV